MTNEETYGIICECKDPDENYGCTDCQNTGWWHLKCPEPGVIHAFQARIKELETMCKQWESEDILEALKCFHSQKDFKKLQLRIKKLEEALEYVVKKDHTGSCGAVADKALEEK